MKESLVSRVDSTETLAPRAAGGERLSMAYWTGMAASGRFYSLIQPSAALCAAEPCRDAAVCGRFRDGQAVLSPMTPAWLGRRGGGGFRSSDSLRGSLIFLVMGRLLAKNYAFTQTVNQPLTHCFYFGI